MTPEAAMEIAELSLSLLKGSPTVAPADVLVQIISKARQAYQAHTGQPLDPTLIKAEEPV